MDLNNYQKSAKKTAIYPNIGRNFLYPTLGLVGEAGEIANKVKKIIRDDGGKVTKAKRDELFAEIGDVLWYMAQLSTELKLKLSDIAKYNLKKLSQRKKEDKLHGSGDNR